mmetsp:Transcript_17081/g.40765  ORF Transcript_17081/g.40765 Transcript_17081/m.40765 type:complete len:293 (+) Transcript_17081:80-958(+)
MRMLVARDSVSPYSVHAFMPVEQGTVMGRGLARAAACTVTELPCPNVRASVNVGYPLRTDKGLTTEVAIAVKVPAQVALFPTTKLRKEPCHVIVIDGFDDAVIALAITGPLPPRHRFVVWGREPLWLVCEQLTKPWVQQTQHLERCLCHCRFPKTNGDAGSRPQHTVKAILWSSSPSRLLAPTVTSQHVLQLGGWHCQVEHKCGRGAMFSTINSPARSNHITEAHNEPLAAARASNPLDLHRLALVLNCDLPVPRQSDWCNVCVARQEEHHTGELVTLDLPWCCPRCLELGF